MISEMYNQYALGDLFLFSGYMPVTGPSNPLPYPVMPPSSQPGNYPPYPTNASSQPPYPVMPSNMPPYPNSQPPPPYPTAGQTPYPTYPPVTSTYNQSVSNS